MKKVLWILQGVFFCAAFYFVGLHEQGGAMWMGWVALACMTLAAVLQLAQNRAEHKKNCPYLPEQDTGQTYEKNQPQYKPKRGICQA